MLAFKYIALRSHTFYTRDRHDRRCDAGRISPLREISARKAPTISHNFKRRDAEINLEFWRI